MLINLKNIFARMQPSRQDIQTLSGIVTALADGSKGPARGGILDGEEAAKLRALIAEGGHFHVPSDRTPGARAGQTSAPQSDRRRTDCCGMR